MSVLDFLPTYALLGIPLGLVLGLALGLVANRDEGWGGYGSFRRRAARLGHIAAVALPLLGGFYALGVDAWTVDRGIAAWGAGLWIGGGVLLVTVLFLSAWRRSWRFALPLPALASKSEAQAGRFRCFSGLSQLAQQCW